MPTQTIEWPNKCPALTQGQSNKCLRLAQLPLSNLGPVGQPKQDNVLVDFTDIITPLAGGDES
jgi:hypothetical protein